MCAGRHYLPVAHSSQLNLNFPSGGSSWLKNRGHNSERRSVVAKEWKEHEQIDVDILARRTKSEQRRLRSRERERVEEKLTDFYPIRSLQLPHSDQ